MNIKKTITTIALVLFPFFLVTASADEETGTAHTHVIIQVKGLACPFCAQGIEKHLKKLDAVEAVDTSLKKGEVVMHLKPCATVSEKEVRAAVKKAGFTVDRIRFDPMCAPEEDQKSDPDENQ